MSACTKCPDCARYRSDKCDQMKCNPDDHPRSGEETYRWFEDPLDDPKRYCYLCKSRLERRPSKKESREFTSTPLRCNNPDCTLCGEIVGYDERQFRRKYYQELMFE